MISSPVRTDFLGEMVWFTVPDVGISRKKLKHALLEAGIYDYLPQKYADKDFYNSKNIRDIIKNVLYDCSAISIRASGGVYFTPYAHSDAVELLKVFAKNVGATLHSMPAVDTPMLRETMGIIMSDYVCGEITDLLHKINTITANGTHKVTHRVARGYVSRIRELLRLVSNYKNITDNYDELRGFLQDVLAQALYLLDGEGL